MLPLILAFLLASSAAGQPITLPENRWPAAGDFQRLQLHDAARLRELALRVFLLTQRLAQLESLRLAPPASRPPPPVYIPPPSPPALPIPEPPPLPPTP